MLLPMGEQAATMTSIEFWDRFISPARADAGEKVSTYQNFFAKVVDELDLSKQDVTKHISEKINGLGLTRKYSTPFATLNLEQMTLVGMRESKAVRRSVLEKLKELQANQRPTIPQTLPEALRLAADLAEQKAEVESQLALAAPKAAFVDSYVDAKGLMTFRQVAKVLKVKESYLSAFLMDKGIMYRLNGKLTAHHNHINAGRFSTKTGESGRNGRAFVQTYFTAKGVNWLAGLLEAEKKDSAA